MHDVWPRAILHVDMDAFYASVEQHDQPALQGKPVVVGGSPASRGVVSAASYEARAFGVHSAMPTARALRLCPHAVFLSVRMDRYVEVSRQVHAVFERFTPAIQPVSVDEAFLDVTGCQRLLGSPATIAQSLKRDVHQETGLTASVGVAPNRFVAKIASDLDKPDGLVVIRANEVLERLAPLSVSRIWGVGRVTTSKLQQLGIETIAQLRGWPRQPLVDHFGSGGAHLYDLARGNDISEVLDRDPEKSVSNETTFAQDIRDVAYLERTLLRLADKVASRVRAKGLSGRTVQLKLRYDDFSTVTRRRTLPSATCVGSELFHAARELLRQRTDAGARPVRLIGVGLSGFQNAHDQQGVLFSALQESDPGQQESLERAADAIRHKLGPDAISRGTDLFDADEGMS